MRCPICGHENPPENVFCTVCGAPLASLPEEEPSVQSGEEAPAPAVTLDELAEQVYQLRRALHAYGTRLSSLERFTGAVPSAPATGQPQPVAQPPSAIQEAGLPPSYPPDDEVAGTPPGPGRWQQAISGWEQVLGGNWLAIVGGLAVVIGVGFFLKLAFDNDWIGETGRVVLGVVSGLAFLGAGEYWAKRYGGWAQAVTATGIGVLYLSIFAALVLYNLIGVYPAFAFLALVTAVSGAASLRYEAAALATLSVVGGMVTPFLLVGRLPNIYILAAYVGMLDVGVMGLASFRNWRPLVLLGFLGSLALFLFWYTTVVEGDRPVLGEVVLTGHFLLFVGATTLFHLVWQKRPRTPDLTLMTLNAGTYLVISYALLRDDFGSWMGLFAVGMATFYAVLASRALAIGGRNADLTLFLSGIAVVLLTVAVPLQFEGPWVPIAWATEGVVLTALGVRGVSLPMRISAMLVLLAMIGWLLLVEMDVDLRTFQPILNGRFAGFAAGIAALYLSAYFLWRGREQLAYPEETTIILPGVLLVANLLTLWILSFEIIAYVDSRSGLRFDVSQNLKSFGLSFLWGAYSIALVIVGIVRRIRMARLGGLALFWVTIFKVFLVDSFGLTEGYRVASFISLGSLLLATGFLYHRYRTVIRGFLLD